MSDKHVIEQFLRRTDRYGCLDFKAFGESSDKLLHTGRLKKYTSVV